MLILGKESLTTLCNFCRCFLHVFMSLITSFSLKREDLKDLSKTHISIIVRNLPLLYFNMPIDSLIILSYLLFRIDWVCFGDDPFSYQNLEFDLICFPRHAMLLIKLMLNRKVCFEVREEILVLKQVGMIARAPTRIFFKIWTSHLLPYLFILSDLSMLSSFLINSTPSLLVKKVLSI